jgi:hypothetical protein
MSRGSSFVKNYPGMQVSSALSDSFTTPSAIVAGEPTSSATAIITGGVLSDAVINGINNRVYSQFFNIATTGNAILFGEYACRPILTYNQNGSVISASAGVGSATRMVWNMGQYGGGFLVRHIEYYEFATKGTSNFFGVFTVYGGNRWTCSSATRGVFGGGNLNPRGSFGGVVTTINYVTMATQGNGTSFGTMVSPNDEMNGLSSTTRGVFGANNVAVVYGRTIDLEYITIASTGNSITFGNMTTNGGVKPATAASSTRGLFATGYSTALAAITVTTDYITIATLGDGISFGNLSQGRSYSQGSSSSIRAVISGGFSGATNFASMEYYTIATTGTATSFGNLLSTNYDGAVASNSHGGI